MNKYIAIYKDPETNQFLRFKCSYDQRIALEAIGSTKYVEIPLTGDIIQRGAIKKFMRAGEEAEIDSVNISHLQRMDSSTHYRLYRVYEKAWIKKDPIIYEFLREDEVKSMLLETFEEINKSKTLRQKSLALQADCEDFKGEGFTNISLIKK